MKKKVKILLIVLIILLIIACIAVAGGYLYFKKKLNKITYKPLDETDLGIEQTQEEDIDENIDLGETTKFVIFGSDSRDEDDETKGRSDSIIIVCLNHVNKSITFISIPRDSYVNVPGYGMTKINHAYAYGQEQLSIKTINTNFGTDLSQYLTIDFSGMEKCIDRVGGVEVTLSQAEVNEINRRLGRGNNNVSAPGTQILNGPQALAHSRNRYVGNDFARTQRQRDILVSLINKLKNESISEVLSVSDYLLENITTNIDLTNYKSIIKKLYEEKDQYTQHITSVMIPEVSYGYDAYINGIYYYRFPIELAKADFKKYYYNTAQ